VATTKYVVPFSSIVQKENFMGTQFHPEKSGKEGSKLLGSFINL
jgi:glutamine amidotransferase